MRTDLLGNTLAPHEAELVEIYDRLKTLIARDDLPPCVAAGARHALAYCAQAVTDLGLEFEHFVDMGV